MGDNASAVDYINFAATISSLILAIIAIVYSTYANFSSVAVFSQLTDSAKKITSVTDELAVVASRLDTRAEELPGILNDLQGRFNHFVGNVGTPKPQSEYSNVTDNDVRDLLLNANFGILFCFQIIILAYEKDDKTLKLFGDHSNVIELPFLAGTSVVLYFSYILGIVRFSRPDADTYVISYVHPVILTELVGRIRTLLAIKDPDQREADEEQLRLAEQIYGNVRADDLNA